MSSEELERREAYFKEFGEILVRRHGQNFCAADHNQAGDSEAAAAIRLGRYLRAARLNAGFSVVHLAEGSKISNATLTALEQGLILSRDIKPKWLKTLAALLDTDVEEFYCILGRDIPGGNSHWFAGKLVTRWQNGKRWSESPLISIPVYAASLTIFLGIAISALSFLALETPEPPSSPGEINSFAVAKPEPRLNIIKAERDLESQSFNSPSNPGYGGSCCEYRLSGLAEF